VLRDDVGMQKIEINKKEITLDRGYDEFINYCKVRNLRPMTINFYDNTMRTIYKFIEPKRIIKDIDKTTVDNFILNIKDITLNTYLRALKTILYYFMKLDYIEDKIKTYGERLNNHDCRIDKIEQEVASFRTELKNLCDNLKSLTAVLKWLIILGVEYRGLASFFM